MECLWAWDGTGMTEQATTTPFSTTVVSDPKEANNTMIQDNWKFVSMDETSSNGIERKANCRFCQFFFLNFSGHFE